MTSYIAYLPPEDMMESTEEIFRLVPDKKATFALIFPPLWLAWKRLWLALLAYIVVMVAIFLLAFLYPSIAVSYLSILPGFYLLLEGHQLVRNDLENKGWKYAGIVEGENLEEAEIRFLINSGDRFAKPHFIKKQDDDMVVSGSAANQTNTSLFPE